MKTLNRYFTVFLLWLIAGAAQATVITFEEFGIVNAAGNGEVTGNEWLGSGVAFSTNGIALNIGSTTGSSPNSLGADAQFANDFSGNITIQFTGGASYTDVSFIIFNPTFQAIAYAADNTLLGVRNATGAFTDLFSFAGLAVNRVEITGSFYAIDDLSFSTLAGQVPVPAPIALIGLGLLLMGIGRTRDRQIG